MLQIGTSRLQIGFTVEGCPVSSYSSTWRLTAGGKTDTYQRQGAATSSQREKERADRLRADADAIMVGGKNIAEPKKNKWGRSWGRARQRSSGWVCSGIVIGNYFWPDGRQANSPHCARLALTAQAASIIATPQSHTRRLNAHPTHTYSVR